MGSLWTILGTWVFKPLIAQFLVYPHRVLVILVTSLEEKPTLLNVSVIDFRTRKALKCQVPVIVPQSPAMTSMAAGPKLSGSSIQLAS